MEGGEGAVSVYLDPDSARSSVALPQTQNQVELVQTCAAVQSLSLLWFGIQLFFIRILFFPGLISFVTNGCYLLVTDFIVCIFKWQLFSGYLSMYVYIYVFLAGTLIVPELLWQQVIKIFISSASTRGVICEIPDCFKKTINCLKDMDGTNHKLDNCSSV